jgi:peptidoglycan hydrolase FlgJ
MRIEKLHTARFGEPLPATAPPPDPNRPTGAFERLLSAAGRPPAHSPMPLSTTARADAATGEERLREVCRQFEAFFTAQLMQTMRESGSVEGLVKTSRAEKVFRSQHDAELARHLASRGALGLGDLLYRQLSEQIGTTALQPQTEGE